MTAMPCCRVGDTISAVCSIDGRVSGTWSTTTNITTTDGGLHIILVGDSGVASCGHTFTATSGSITTTINGKYIHRIGDVVTISVGGTGASLATAVPLAVLTC